MVAETNIITWLVVALANPPNPFRGPPLCHPSIRLRTGTGRADIPHDLTSEGSLIHVLRRRGEPQRRDAPGHPRRAGLPVYQRGKHVKAAEGGERGSLEETGSRISSLRCRTCHPESNVKKSQLPWTARLTATLNLSLSLSAPTRDVPRTSHIPGRLGAWAEKIASRLRAPPTPRQPRPPQQTRKDGDGHGGRRLAHARLGRLHGLVSPQHHPLRHAIRSDY